VGAPAEPVPALLPVLPPAVSLGFASVLPPHAASAMMPMSETPSLVLMKVIFPPRGADGAFPLRSVRGGLSTDTHA
jgi:hypothetical protein